MEVKRITTALGRFSNSTVTGGDVAFKNDNVADYTVKKKIEGKYKTKRIVYWIVFAVVILALVGGFAAIGGPALAAICGVIEFIAGRIIYQYTWCYFDIQNSYAIEGGEFFATEIYGEKKDKLLLRIRMSQIKKVAPYRDSFRTEADSGTYSSSLFIAESSESPDLFFFTYDDEKGGEGIVYFDACSKSLKAFKYYRSDAVTVGPTSR